MPKNGPYDLPPEFSDFALMPKFNDNIEFLKNMAESEDWDYKNTVHTNPHPILRNYIRYTYQRIAEEKKIAVSADEEYSCWNTGLITDSQEAIFIIFEKNKFPDSKPYWHFNKFARKGEWDLNKFVAIPEMAHYFDDPSVLVFDTRMELRINVEHIIEDNKPRFPSELQAMSNFALQNLVKGAIDSAIERAKRNYKTAIPQYYQGNMQLLLPLSLQNPKKADLALAVEKLSGFYRGSTCLTLDMAYNNARQLARPDRDWLEP
ncbi:TPA: DUF3825 domain-containing protein [Aeromonas hydrophila]|uniref:DUF3825 domain-containing protein n=1 Tax=Aeromonas hydrophila TaxID=644 RepID=UPI002B48130B|nr:DUF3825 domain-containing protein [Aeromonas hydrophila]